MESLSNDDNLCCESNGGTSCHQSGPKEVRSEKSFWYAFSIILNEDDIRKQLSELNLRPEKLRRGQEIKIDIYIEETRKKLVSFCVVL